MTGRARTGRFQRGMSGNPNGRPRSPSGEMTPEDLLKIIMKVATKAIPHKSGDNKTVTLFEANVMSLGMGTAANRLAARLFIDLTREAARKLELIRLEKERLEVIAARDEATNRRMHPKLYYDEAE